MFKHYLLALLLAISFRPAYSAVFFVAPTGNDSGSGTMQQPFLTLQRAQTAVAAGDTVYIRGGVYMMQNAQIAGYANPYAYVTLLNKSGSATAGRINYWAYPGEQPVFNYANVNPNVTNPGAPFAGPYRLSAIEVTGGYIHIRGLEIVGVRVPLVANNVNTQSICVSQSGATGNNIFERLSMHDGQAIGFYLSRGGNTLVLNCDAYRNNDNVNISSTTGAANGGNVDGFGCHPNRIDYTGNVFRGCRAWQNSDDGYDCISAYTATTFENCWAFYNGYTQNFTSRGDGNGFKAGGYGSAALTSIPSPVPSNTIRFCVSVRNKANGFYSNHHLEGSTWYSNTAYQNGVNYDMLNRRGRATADYLVDVPGYNHTLRNNISLLARSTNAATRDLNNVDPAANVIDHNALPINGITATASDFISLDTTLLRAPRQVDGSLPVITTLRLAPGSSLIDAGINVGFPYSGTAPDLGAYESGELTIWTGAAGTDWFSSANWTAGVPTATLDALIPMMSSGRYPVIGSGTASAQNLTVSPGATLSQSGGTLSLTGHLTNNGTYVPSGGVLATTGSTSQLLGGNSPLALQNLSVGPAGAALRAPVSFRRALTLLGDLSTDNQLLTLLSSVSGGVAMDGLVVNSGGVVMGPATVQRAIDGSRNAGLGYRQYAAPVRSAIVADLATTATGGSFVPVVNPAYNSAAAPGSVAPFPTVFGYDDSRLALANSLSSFDKGFVSPAALSDALAVGRGYTVNIGAGEVVSFEGRLNAGTLTLPLSSARASYPDGGWQLLGNPYPAPLDYSLVTAADRPGLEDAIYVYASTGQYAGQYRSYVNNIGNPVLPLGQAYFARAATGQPTASMTFRDGQRLTAPNATTFQRTTPETRPLVQLSLQGAGLPLLDEATVYFERGATSTFDAAYDAAKLANPSGLNLATSLLTGQQLSIDGQPELGQSPRIVPLALGVPTAGSYTLTASQLLNLGNQPVYLRDNQLGTLTDLRQQPSYPFTVTNATALNTTRFELVFSRSALATASPALAQQVALYPNPAKSQVAIELPRSLQAQPVTAALVDALGRVVRQQVLPAGAATHALPLADVSAGVYSLRLTTAVGTVVKKLVVE